MVRRQNAAPTINPQAKQSSPVVAATPPPVILPENPTISVRSPRPIPTVQNQQPAAKRPQLPIVAPAETTHPLDSDTNAAAYGDKTDEIPSTDTDMEYFDNDQIESDLDVARAYISMGDITEAREILDDIINSANNKQHKKTAQELLNQIQGK